MRKRIFAILVSMAMILAMMPAAVFADAEDPQLVPDTLWTGCEYYSSAHFDQDMDGAEIVSVTSSDEDVIFPVVEGDESGSIADYYLEPREPGTSTITVTYILDGVTKSASAVYKVKEFPKFIEQLWIDGEELEPVEYEKLNYIDYYGYTGVSPSIKFVLADGWTLISGSYFVDEETYFLDEENYAAGYEMEFPEESSRLYSFLYFENEDGDKIMLGIRFDREGSGEDPSGEAGKSIGSASFDQSYCVLDDNPSTPYKDWFYFVPEGTVLEPIVKDVAGNVLGADCYKASYSECMFYEERNEWDKIDENNWIYEFPTTPGVYFCKIEGVAPYSGSFEWIDLIRITEKLDSSTFNEFFKVAGWYGHELLAGNKGFSFSVPCKNFADYSGKKFTKKDLDSIVIKVTTSDGTVYWPTVTEDQDYPGDYIYSFDTPALSWGDAYTISFRHGDTIKTMKGVAKKKVKLTYTVSNLTYTGKSQSPKVTVKYGNTTLKKGVDYKVELETGGSTVKNVGGYVFYISAPLTSKYVIGEAKSFKVNPKGTSISKLTPAKKAFTVKWKKQATQTTGYEIQYSLKSNFSGAKKVTISKTSTTSKKITKLKAKKTYYVRIRTYKKIGKTKYYSSWSSKKVKTK